eukprot:scaffold407_cov251-Pinguiococcus_pyrenoidosus.AAC.3
MKWHAADTFLSTGALLKGRPSHLQTTRTCALESLSFLGLAFAVDEELAYLPSSFRLLALEAVAEEVVVPIDFHAPLSAPVSLLIKVVKVCRDLLDEEPVPPVIHVDRLQLCEEVAEHLRSLGPVRRRLRSQVLPIHSTEPRMLLDLLNPVPPDAAVRRGHQAQQEVHALGTERLLRGRGDLQELAPAKDLPAGHDRLVGVERGVAHEALVHDHPQGPPVAGVIISLLRQHLRSDVVRRSDRGVHEVPLAMGLLLPGVGPLHHQRGLAYETSK